jgi:hypothetical protein
MSIEKEVNRLITLAIELLKRVTIPKILVKLSMIKFGNLGEEVTHILEYQIEIE